MLFFSGILGFSLAFLGSQVHSQVLEDWVGTYDGDGSAQDQAEAIAGDQDGYVYVTGGSDVGGGYTDYVTIKYAPDGAEEWTVPYDGPAGLWDYAKAIAVDETGYVYVSGFSYQAGGNSDYATVKYTPSGIEEWSMRYNGTGNNIDEAVAIAIDASGNVYVTGRSYRTTTGMDYTTIKYNSSGGEEWARSYDSGANYSDEALDIAVDGDGNVYVTGRSQASDATYDFATVKYNSSGTQQWAMRYSGYSYYDAEAHALALDPSGNVCVTGWAFESTGGFNYVTIRYSSGGTQQWINAYDNSWDDWAEAIAIDAVGNVYVTGASQSALFSPLDFATVKYSPNGTELWEARYTGPAGYDDWATAIAVDTAGNVAVTGYSNQTSSYPYDLDLVTIKYTPQGTA